VPSGMQPRAAVVYIMVAALECAALCGAAPSLHSEIDAAVPMLERLAEEWGPASAPDSRAKALASELRGTVPIVHGALPTVATARRWRTQLNENAKLPAFVSELPESNHNEICGWERGIELAPFAGVFLEDPDQHPRIVRRFDLVCAEFQHVGGKVLRVRAERGESRLDRVLELLFLGDLVSVYLAALDGVDPTPVEPLDRFKSELARS
jgi:glucose/mannose-6-phosphate isomerase